MTLARRSPITRTLGIQFVVMSTVLALIVRIFMTATRPMPVIATSRNATTLMILARIEMVANITGLFALARWRVLKMVDRPKRSAPISNNKATEQLLTTTPYEYGTSKK